MLAIMKVTMPVMTAAMRYEYERNIAGGRLPKSVSLITPPPSAVTIPQNRTPKISRCLCIAAIAPETANATVPTISSAKNMPSIYSTPNNDRIENAFI